MALVEYKNFVEQKEDIIKPKDFYEAGAVIGEEEQKSDNPLGSGQYNETLDEILRRVVTNEEAFQLIKSGSRRRFLSDDKILYIKTAVELGYTFKEIGKNIGISAVAVNKMLLRWPGVKFEGSNYRLSRGDCIVLHMCFKSDTIKEETEV